MSLKARCSTVVVCAVVMLAGASAGGARANQPAATNCEQEPVTYHGKLAGKAGWTGARAGAGQLAGPVGSAVVGAAHYRKDLTAGGRKRAKGAAKIGAPVAATLIAGPVGAVSYGSGYFIATQLMHHREPTPGPCASASASLSQAR
jgi:hypothetical protein